MTDLTPNDLSHLTDEEFNTLAPQGYHATGPAKVLSPAAQSVLDAFLGDCEDSGLQMDDLRENVAAALRALASQCLHVTPKGVHGNYAKRYMLAGEIRAIAAELEGLT
jgi:hypothetical protein